MKTLALTLALLASTAFGQVVRPGGGSSGCGPGKACSVTTLTTTGNATVGGTLAVTGAVTLSSTIQATRLTLTGTATALTFSGVATSTNAIDLGTTNNVRIAGGQNGGYWQFGATQMTTTQSLVVGGSGGITVSGTTAPVAITGLFSTSYSGNDSPILNASAGTLWLNGDYTDNANFIALRMGDTSKFIYTAGSKLGCWSNGSTGCRTDIDRDGFWRGGINPGGTVTFPGFGTPTNSSHTCSTTGGTLAAGTYYYRYTCVDDAGLESAASAETSCTIGSGTTGSVTVGLGSGCKGARSYNIYGRSTGAEQLLLNLPYSSSSLVTNGASYRWVDTGVLTPLGALPTQDNSGGAIVNGAGLQVGSSGTRMTDSRTGSYTIDFANVVANTCNTSNQTLTGVSANDPVSCSFPAALEAGLTPKCWATAGNQITFQVCNVTTSDINPASGTFAARYFH